MYVYFIAVFAEKQTVNKLKSQPDTPLVSEFGWYGFKHFFVFQIKRFG